MSDEAPPRHHLQPVPEPDGSGTRTPPHDRRAERAILGLILAQPSLIDQTRLAASDFYEPRHEWLWQRITDHYASAPDFTPVTLNAALVQDPESYVREGGGAAFLFELVEAAASESPASAGYLIRTIRQHAQARQLLYLGERLTQLGYSSRAAGADAVLSDAMDDIEKALREQWFGATATDLHANLAWVASGTPPVVDPPTHCHRSDGQALFYAGRVNGIYGDPEAAKT